jgi:hypothetical protein
MPNGGNGSVIERKDGDKEKEDGDNGIPKN